MLRHLPILLSALFLAQQETPPTRKGTEVPAELARQIDQAVDRGVAWVRQQQQKNGSFRFSALKQDIYGEHPLGETCLAVLAMLSAGIPREDPAIAEGIEYVLDNPARGTYERGLSLMALDMAAAPSWERRALEKMTAEKRKAYKFPRAHGPKERERMAEDSAQLLKSWGQGYWSYEMKSGSAGDISNTQFALLGLKAAARCGLDVPVAVFEKTMQIFLQTQTRVGPRVTYPQAFGEPGEPGGYYIDLPAEARGWSYWHGNYGASENEITGSRTHIGIACIALCRDEILRRGDEDARMNLKARDAAVKDAILDGLAWAHANYSVEKNPGTEDFMKKAPWPVNGAWYYYYLYAVERTGALLPTRLIGRRDWYQEGAEALIKRQKKDGSWIELNPLVDTAFALLFLRKATTPSIHSMPRDFAH